MSGNLRISRNMEVGAAICVIRTTCYSAYNAKEASGHRITERERCVLTTS
jgi:hypothetical protein